MAILWRNQRSIKCIAAYIESFPCGEPAGYKLESQRCYKSHLQVQGHVSRAKHGFIPHCRYIKWRPETHLISAKDVHFIVSYTWVIIAALMSRWLLAAGKGRACEGQKSVTRGGFATALCIFWPRSNPMLRCPAGFFNYIVAFSIQVNPRSLSIFSRIPSAHMDAQCMPPQNMRCESRSQLAWITIKVPGILLTSRNAGVEGPQSRSQRTKQERMDKPDTIPGHCWKPECFSIFLGQGDIKELQVLKIQALKRVESRKTYRDHERQSAG